MIRDVPIRHGTPTTDDGKAVKPGRFREPLIYMPNRCTCCEPSRRMSTIKTPEMLVKYCPVTRAGYSQKQVARTSHSLALEPGTIITGVFVGDARNFLDRSGR